jgi:hypothetical protein
MGAVRGGTFSNLPTCAYARAPVFEKGWELDDKPALEWYIKSPPFYKPENYITDFCVPIK